MEEDAYAKALASLFAARRAGIDFGLERIEACLGALALTHTPLATIQVAGTNGKGSTSAFIAKVLQRAGYRVGVFSSPHLVSICERFHIGGASITRADFLRGLQAVDACAADLTFFERITAMAAWLFYDAKVDIAIYEVGLGGRLDSTTAIPADLSIITGIALDHCEFLGDTLEQIAFEKAGIFRPGVPAIIGLAAETSIRQYLARLASVPILVGPEHLAAVPDTLALKGAHQRGNAACAVAAIVALRERGLRIDEAAVTEGLAAAKLAGRLEEVEPDLWIDGAHNAQAARALSVALAGQYGLTLVVGLSTPKDVGAFLGPLRVHCGALIATQAAGDRAYPAETIAREARTLGFECVEVEADAGAALRLARSKGGKAVVTGSLILLGEILTGIGYPGADPQLVTDPGTARR